MKNIDPKQRQQLIVLTLLFLVALGYAGYQLFMPATTGASNRSTTQSSSSQAESSSAPAESEESAAWLRPGQPVRDPFVVPPQFDNLRNMAALRNTPPPRVSSLPNVGTLPPMPVAPLSGGTPAAPGISPQPAEGQTNDAPEPQPPSIVVTGLVLGEHPVAIIRAGEGRQRIVQPGQQIEGGYVLRAVLREGIVIEKDGKTITLGPGGNTHAK